MYSDYPIHPYSIHTSPSRTYTTRNFTYIKYIASFELLSVTALQERGVWGKWAAV